MTTTRDNCPTCQSLEARLAEAKEVGDESQAVDCRVLLRRHPEHGGPLPKSEQKETTP
ncbi:hypothetical protein ITI46_34050 [Streptomyces oryzae]|uniref:Uncharacterized protein n=1 Tax=Streptomyces oryzae TaxID=1434886 RepID=A0ABS3XMJ6_9ACTN|nr:hypothetical protein [Streptomyces oryzae]MBO8196616.1 hypothetical protein [Streptomyces oryzae]